MTDKPTPDFDDALERVRDAWAETLVGLRAAWESAKPILAVLAENAETRAAAQEGIGHAYDEEPDRLAETLDALTSEQLRDIADAAALLGEQALARAAVLTPEAHTGTPPPTPSCCWFDGDRCMTHGTERQQDGLETDDSGPAAPPQNAPGRSGQDYDAIAASAGWKADAKRYYDSVGDWKQRTEQAEQPQEARVAQSRADIVAELRAAERERDEQRARADQAENRAALLREQVRAEHDRAERWHAAYQRDGVEYGEGVRRTEDAIRRAEDAEADLQRVRDLVDAADRDGTVSGGTFTVDAVRRVITPKDTSTDA